MKIVLDTNVIMDLLADRRPFADNAESIMQLVAKEVIAAAVTANSITDLAYLLRKHLPDGDAIRLALLDLMGLVEVIAVGREQCVRATELPVHDYEDALLAVCAKQWGADMIVTRNTRDFRQSPIQAVTPGDFLVLVSRIGESIAGRTGGMKGENGHLHPPATEKP